MQSEEIKGYIAERLRLLRGIRKLTLEKLAKKMGVSRKQIQNYENSECAISIERLWQLAQVLRVKVNFFLEGIDDRPVVSNDDLNIIYMIAKIKDQKVKSDIIQLIKVLAE